MEQTLAKKKLRKLIMGSYIFQQYQKFSKLTLICIYHEKEIILTSPNQFYQRNRIEKMYHQYKSDIKDIIKTEKAYQKMKRKQNKNKQIYKDIRSLFLITLFNQSLNLDHMIVNFCSTIIVQQPHHLDHDFTPNFTELSRHSTRHTYRSRNKSEKNNGGISLTLKEKNYSTFLKEKQKFETSYKNFKKSIACQTPKQLSSQKNCCGNNISIRNIHESSKKLKPSMNYKKLYSLEEIQTNPSEFTQSIQRRLVYPTNNFLVNSLYSTPKQHKMGLSISLNNSHQKIRCHSTQKFLDKGIILKTIQSIESQRIPNLDPGFPLVNSRKFRYDESMIQKKTILQNFRILSKTENSIGSLDYVAIQKQLGLILQIKTIPKNFINIISNELLINSSLHFHPNLIRHYQTVSHGEEYLFLYEYSETTLKQLIGRISQSMMLAFTLDIMEGMKYLHSRNIIFQQLGSQNIKIINGVCKIGDFNKAKLFSTPYQFHKISQCTKDYKKIGKILIEVMQLQIRYEQGMYQLKTSKFSKKLQNFLKYLLNSKQVNDQLVRRHQWINNF